MADKPTLQDKLGSLPEDEFSSVAQAVAEEQARRGGAPAQAEFHRKVNHMTDNEFARLKSDLESK